MSTQITVYTIGRHGFKTLKEAEEFKTRYGYEGSVKTQKFTPRYYLGKGPVSYEHVYAEEYLSDRLTLNWEVPAKKFSPSVSKFLRTVMGSDGGTLHFHLSLLEGETQLQEVREIIIGEGSNKPFTPPKIEVYKALPSELYLYAFTCGYAEGYLFHVFLSMQEAMQYIKDIRRN